MEAVLERSMGWMQRRSRIYITSLKPGVYSVYGCVYSILSYYLRTVADSVLFRTFEYIQVG